MIIISFDYYYKPLSKPRENAFVCVQVYWEKSRNCITHCSIHIQYVYTWVCKDSDIGDYFLPSSSGQYKMPTNIWEKWYMINGYFDPFITPFIISPHKRNIRPKFSSRYKKRKEDWKLLTRIKSLLLFLLKTLRRKISV